MVEWVDAWLGGGRGGKSRENTAHPTFISDVDRTLLLLNWYVSLHVTIRLQAQDFHEMNYRSMEIESKSSQLF